MNVQSAINAAQQLTPDTILDSAKRLSKFDRAAQKDSPSDATPSTDDGATDLIGSSDGGDQRGVLRLLEEGHFRGVADVRLRINFFEKLSARADQDASAAAKEHSPDLIDAISAQADTVADALGLDEDARSAFDESQAALASAINEAVEEFGSSADRDALEQSLRSAFETLLGPLREFLPSETVEPPEKEVSLQSVALSSEALVAGGEVYAPAGTAESPARVLEPANSSGAATVDPLTELVNVFSQALATFLSSIGSTARLSDPAPANGNGRAYAKFLAVYNELRGDHQPAVDEVV